MTHDVRRGIRHDLRGADPPGVPACDQPRRGEAARRRHEPQPRRGGDAARRGAEHAAPAWVLPPGRVRRRSGVEHAAPAWSCAASCARHQNGPSAGRIRLVSSCGTRILLRTARCAPAPARAEAARRIVRSAPERAFRRMDFGRFVLRNANSPAHGAPRAGFRSGRRRAGPAPPQAVSQVGCPRIRCGRKGSRMPRLPWDG